MKLLTWNVNLPPWVLEKRKFLPLITSALIAENADIIFLQEVFFHDDAKYIIKALNTNGYSDSFYSKSLLTISKTPLLSREFVEFSNQGPLLSWAILDRLYKKAWQIVEISINKMVVHIVNAHPLGGYGHDKGIYRETRKKQTIEICDYLIEKGIQKFILTGDFNFDLGSPTYEFIKKQFRLRDPLENLVGKTLTGQNLRRKRFNVKRMEQRVDHFFIKGIESNKMTGEIIFREPVAINGIPTHPSDHFGLKLEIDFTTQ